MRGVWSEERKFAIWLEIETLACEAMAELGLIPKVGAVAIAAKPQGSAREIDSIVGRKDTAHG